MIQAELVHDAASDLGEGVIWSPVESLLLWVDINAGTIHRHDHRSGPMSSVGMGDTVGSIGLRPDGGWVLGLGRGVALTDSGDRVVERIDLPGVPADHRTNDGAVDPAGRLFQGTMPLEERRPEAGLFLVEADLSARRVVDGVTISNGIDWSLDQSLMYYIDSAAMSVDVFDFDTASGTLSDRRPLVEFDGSHGGPDGMTVDSEGCLWVAFFRGGCVRRYSPESELLEIVSVDAPNVTSCAFGGPDLDTLYITTARHTMTPADVAERPLAGGLFAADVAITGRPPNLFAR